MQDEEARDLVWNLVDSIKTCMMITRCEAPGLRARPMHSIPDAGRNAIWFVSDRLSAKQDEFEYDSAICLAYADPKAKSYVSLSGQVLLIDDEARMSQFWNEQLSAYWSKGPSDPTIALLRFTPQFGEYWDAPGNPIIVALKFIEAKITGSRPELGKNAKVDLG